MQWIQEPYLDSYHSAALAPGVVDKTPLDIKSKIDRTGKAGHEGERFIATGNLCASLDYNNESLQLGSPKELGTVGSQSRSFISYSSSEVYQTHTAESL